MANWPAVLGFSDGEYVEHDTLNRPIRQLRERTDWLRQRISDMLGTANHESLRLVDVPLTADGANAPDVRDFVYLNPDTHTYEKAKATAEVYASIYETAADESYAVGLLVSKTGNLGTVVIAGRAWMTSDDVWDLSTMLESGESFRSGPYYLSGVDAGKMSGEANGPAIYLGYFADDAETPGYGGYALLSPQYKDVGEAHVHRAFALMSQPAGSQQIHGTIPNATHTLHGFWPRSQAEASHGYHAGTSGLDLIPGVFLTLDNYTGLTIYNVTTGKEGVANQHDTTQVDATSTGGTGDVVWHTSDLFFIDARVRLVVLGRYTGLADTQYTLTLTDSTGIAALGYAPVNGPIDDKSQGFKEAYLSWSSSDPDEGSGLVRLTSYEVPVAFGTKGLRAVLENALESMEYDAAAPATADQYWHWCEASGDDLSRRQWVINAPTDIGGWRARRYRQFFTAQTASDQSNSLILFGGPLINATSKLVHNIHVAAGRMYVLPYTGISVSDGDTLTIGTTVFELDNDASVTAGNVRVAMGVDTAATMIELRDSVVAAGLDDVHVALDADTGTLVIVASSPSITVSSTISVSFAMVTAGTGLTLSGTGKLLVYDDEYNVQSVGASYWDNVNYYTPATLKNGLRIMFIPFSQDATPSTGDVLTIGDTWTTEFVDEAPGAIFEYAMDMHTDLARFYPPMPLSSAVLTVNGIEQSSKLLHDESPSYQAANSTLYWFVNNYAQVPWPVDWDEGSDNPVHSTLYLVHMRVQDTSRVDSLQPAPGSPIRVLRCGTNDAATTGDLMLDVDFSLATVQAGLQGYQVVKAVAGNKLQLGPVVSKIRAGAGISITSRSGHPDGQGEVTISSSTAEGYSGEFSEIALRNAKQELIGPFPYIKFYQSSTPIDPNNPRAGDQDGIPAGFTAKFHVPITLSGEFRIAFYFTVFGLSDIAYTTSDAPYANVRHWWYFDWRYSILRDYEPSTDDYYGTLTDNLIEPSHDWCDGAVPFGFDGGHDYGDGIMRVYKAYDPIIVHNSESDALDIQGRIRNGMGALIPRVGDTKGGVAQSTLSKLTVRPGSLVAIEVQKTLDQGSIVGPWPTPRYSGQVGFINMRWKLFEV